MLVCIRRLSGLWFDAQHKNGRELVASLLGRQIGRRIIWQIGPRFGHDAAQTKE
jgi:hypothetical protein